MKKLILAALSCLSIAGCAHEVIHVPTYRAAAPIEQGHGEAALPDGGLYQGEFAQGLFNGHGVITWANGARHEGEFVNGLPHGMGEHRSATGTLYRGNFAEGREAGMGVLTHANGDRYEGQFHNGNPHGKGVFTDAYGNVFSGDFLNGDFTGSGKFTSRDGSAYEGDFRQWRYEGQGMLMLKTGISYYGRFKNGLPAGYMRVKFGDGTSYEGGMQGWEYQGMGVLATADGTRYTGRFDKGEPAGIMDIYVSSREESYRGELKDWKYHGKGALKGPHGYQYEGGFEYGMFHGDGTLATPDGRRYVGKFSYGNFDGEGVLTYRDASGEKRELAGLWRSGKYAGEDAARYAKEGLAPLNVEKVLYEQREKVAQALARLTPQVPGRPDLYFVSFGSYGEEDVFMKEVRYSAGVMDKVYRVGSRTVSLINNPRTVDEEPLATLTNLEAVLDGVAGKMNVDEDILFLYVTSHGSREHEVAVSLDGVTLQGLTAGRLKNILDGSGIKWKVLVISACYSGGLIDPLKDDHTLVITAARQDRASFGCGTDSDLTYFGKAFFEQLTHPQVGFVEAFAHAREAISAREKQEKLEPSEPQIASAPPIEHKLAEWQHGLEVKPQ